jgi:hypothetical protein
VEAGRQAEGSSAVPFYQFRHLTFQEYLAAVAVVEGHYMEYEKGDSVLTPLQSYLTSEDWKEVIPMSAVLARKQAEPIMAALVLQGNELRLKAETGEDFPGGEGWRSGTGMPAAVARIAQCLVEEAEAAPETLTAALQLVAFFAKGCASEEDWKALCRGPYGEELLHQTWLLLERMLVPVDAWIINTFSELAALRLPEADRDSEEMRVGLQRLLSGPSAEEIARGLATLAGLIMGRSRPENGATLSPQRLINDYDVEKHLFHAEPALWALAAWVWGLARDRDAKKKIPPAPSSAVLDRLLQLFLSDGREEAVTRVAFAITTVIGLPRHAWKPLLTEAQAQKLRRDVKGTRTTVEIDLYLNAARLMVAFHAGSVWSEEELAARLAESRFPSNVYFRAPLDAFLEQMGETGQKYLKSKRRKQGK